MRLFTTTATMVLGTLLALNTPAFSAGSTPEAKTDSKPEAEKTVTPEAQGTLSPLELSVESSYASKNKIMHSRVLSALSATSDGMQDNYDYRDEVVFYIDTDGNFLRPRPAFIDDNDAITIYVFGNATDLQSLVIDLGDRKELELRYGKLADTPVTVSGITTAPPYRIFSFRLETPGTKQLWVMTRSGDHLSRRSVLEISVDDNSRGSFHVGTVLSFLKDPKYGLTTTKTSGVMKISDAENQNIRPLAALFYTPYIWGPRDTKKPMSWKKLFQFYPSVGVVINQPTTNFLIGGSIETKGFLMTVGAHIGRVSRIDTNSGFRVGDPFTGTTDQLPIKNKWMANLFFAWSLDLLTAIDFADKAKSLSTNK